jgi:hypothetical protein
MHPVPSGPWFNEIAYFLGPAYLRNAFTTGTGRIAAPEQAVCAGNFRLGIFD